MTRLGSLTSAVCFCLDQARTCKNQLSTKKPVPITLRPEALDPKPEAARPPFSETWSISMEHRTLKTAGFGIRGPRTLQFFDGGRFASHDKCQT